VTQLQSPGGGSPDEAASYPATASSIFLTTATDVVSMGCFLGLATLFLI
jgi:Mg/Co/Ni transporter MgtE